MSVVKVQTTVRGPMKRLHRQEGDLHVCISGPAGTGKTYSTLMWLHLILLKYPGTRAFLARKTHRALAATTLASFREKVAALSIEQGHLHYYGGSGSEPASFRYENGSRLIIGGLDDPEKIKSLEVSLIVVDEATELKRNDYDVLKTRLRGASPGAYPWYRLILMTNPDAPNHWIKTSDDIDMWYSTHEDNPTLYTNGEWTPEGLRYLASLETLTGVRYDRLRHGKWVAAEGLIYSSFNPAVHVIDRRELPSSWERLWSVDFGHVHPFSAQCWALDPEGVMYLEHEILMTQTTVDIHAAVMLEKFGQRPVAVVVEHAADTRATLEKELGLPLTLADKRVSNGINLTQQRFANNRIYLMRDSLVEADPELIKSGAPTCLEEELLGYAWADGKEQPVKIEDDAADCMRYAVSWVDKHRRGPVQMVNLSGLF